MQKIRPYILPAAIVLGLLLHRWAPLVGGAVPYVIFSILLLNFSAVDLRSLRLNRLDVKIMAFQTIVSVAGYLALHFAGISQVLAQAWLIAVLCPVASSVVVVSSVLGADRRTTTGYTIYGNLLVTVLAPICFSLIDSGQDVPFLQSAWLIFRRIASAIALPFFVALFLQIFFPRVKTGISNFKEWALPLWAFALLATLGQTIDYIFMYYRGNEWLIVVMAVMAVVLCVLQFGVGRIMGKRSGEAIAAGQLTGQKNSAIGIWMASMFLIPLSSVVLAFYSIAQNIFNSWQMWQHDRHMNA